MTDLLNNSFETEKKQFINDFSNEQNSFNSENDSNTSNNVDEMDNIKKIFNFDNKEEGSTGESINVVEQEKKENRPRLRLIRKKRGRGTGGNHNKHTFDNIVRKIKGMVLKNVSNCINEKIKMKYNNNIGFGDNIKKLFLINHAQVKNANIDFNKAFLEKALGEIFSADLSRRVTNYNRDHNKILIEKLKNEEKKKKKEYFNCLFNLTFLDCLKYFRGDNVNNPKYVYIEGLKRFRDIKNEANYKERKDPEFIEYLESFINNYENEINKRIGRKLRQNYNIEN